VSINWEKSTEIIRLLNLLKWKSFDQITGPNQPNMLCLPYATVGNLGKINSDFLIPAVRFCIRLRVSSNERARKSICMLWMVIEEPSARPERHRFKIALFDDNSYNNHMDAGMETGTEFLFECSTPRLTNSPIEQVRRRVKLKTRCSKFLSINSHAFFVYYTKDTNRELRKLTKDLSSHVKRYVFWSAVKIFIIQWSIEFI